MEQNPTQNGEINFDILSQERTVETFIDNPNAKALSDSIKKEKVDTEGLDKDSAKILEKVAAATPEDKKGNEPAPATEAKPGDEAKSPEAKADEAKAPEAKADEKKGDEKVGENGEDKEPVLTFDDEATAKVELKKTDTATDEEVITSWKDVAKEVGLELKDDSLDELKTVLKSKIEDNIAKYEPETQRIIKFTEAGGSPDDFIEPFQKVDTLLGMADADLVAQHFKVKGWDQTKAQTKIEQMAESGELETFAEELKVSLKEYRNEIKENIINDRIKAAEAKRLKMENAFKDEAVKIKATLAETKEFLGTPLSEENRNKIAAKYANGDYENDFKDPKVISDFLLFKEFGEKGITNLKKKLEYEAKKQYQNDRHNVPPKNPNVGAVSSNSAHVADPWSMLEKEKK